VKSFDQCVAVRGAGIPVLRETQNTGEYPMTLSHQPIVFETSKPASSSRQAILSILIACAILFGILQIGVTQFSSVLDQTWAALITATVMLVVAVALEKLLFRRKIARGLSALGFGRPNLRALSVAAIITLLMLAFFPIFSLSTGAQAASNRTGCGSFSPSLRSTALGKRRCSAALCSAAYAGTQRFPSARQASCL
jgi:hypothetical protein